jgi:hypothetical protein
MAENKWKPDKVEIFDEKNYRRQITFNLGGLAKKRFCIMLEAKGDNPLKGISAENIEMLKKACEQIYFISKDPDKLDSREYGTKMELLPEHTYEAIKEWGYNALAPIYSAYNWFMTEDVEDLEYSFRESGEDDR